MFPCLKSSHHYANIKFGHLESEVFKTQGTRSKASKAKKAKPSRRPKNDRDLEEKGDTSSNPIDVDDLLSLFVPRGIQEYVCDFLYHCLALLILLLQTEKEDISFLRAAPLAKIESAFDIHAYDAIGNKMAFKVKAHVCFCL